MTEPRKAAAAIVTGGRDAEQVLLCKRNPELRFMGGSWVFPGGRIDDAEGCQHVVGAACDDEAEAIHAACREIFEESGLLCVKGNLPDRDVARAARLRVLEDASAFDVFLTEHGLTIDAEDFEPAGVWVTPPFVPIRFDTNYYQYHYQGSWHPELIEGEMVDLQWMTPVDARRSWHRNEIKLPHPVAYVLRHLSEESHPNLSAALLRTTVSHDPKFGRVEFRCGINVLALESDPLPPATHTNCMIVGDRELYVIDPGTDHDHEFEHLKVQIEHHLVTGGRVAAVLLTHSHRDHIGAATYLRDQFDVPIWSHAETNRQLGFDVDAFLEDNQVIDVPGDPGWRLRCLHTPGHDPGHLCFLEENTQTLLGGDIVAQMGTIVIAPQIEGNMQHYLDSLNRLLDEEFRVILPAHGLPIGKAKEKIQATIDHRLAREQKLIDALNRGFRSMEDLIAQVYNDVDPSIRPLAEQSLLAHLQKLGHAVNADRMAQSG